MNAAYEPMLAKLQRLPEPLVQEVDAFIDFLQMRWERQSTLRYAQWQNLSETPEQKSAQNAAAEEGMNTYLRDLESYEEILTSDKIAWQ